MSVSLQMDWSVYWAGVGEGLHSCTRTLLVIDRLVSSTIDYHRSSYFRIPQRQHTSVSFLREYLENRSS